MDGRRMLGIAAFITVRRGIAMSEDGTAVGPKILFDAAEFDTVE
jgi:hypothetical protein